MQFKGPEEIARLYPVGVRELQDGGVWETLAGQPTDDSELALPWPGRLAVEQATTRRRPAASYGCGYTADPFDVGTTTTVAISAAARRRREPRQREQRRGGPANRIALIDNTDPELLAQACAEEGRAEFLFTATLLRLVGATGAPAHPTAMF